MKHTKTKRRTGACAGGYENRGVISRTTTSTSGPSSEGPSFYGRFESFGQQKPAAKRSSRRIAGERRKKKKERGREGEKERRERGGLAAPAIEWLCQINNDLWSRYGTHSINIALFDRQITRSRLRAGFGTFYFTE